MTNNNNKEPQIRGWKDIRIDLNTPIGMVIDMLNVLNQRLVSVEDLIKTEGNITLTERYQKEAQEEYERQHKKQMEEEFERKRNEQIKEVTKE